MGTDLELRLQNLLENVEGVGRVKVMLMTGQDTGIYRLYIFRDHGCTDSGRRC